MGHICLKLVSVASLCVGHITGSRHEFDTAAKQNDNKTISSSSLKSQTGVLSRIKRESVCQRGLSPPQI